MLKTIPSPAPSQRRIKYDSRQSFERELALSDLVDEIKSARSFYHLEVACGKASHLEIHDARRESLVPLLMAAYRRITRSTLSKSLARKMVKHCPSGEKWWE